MFLNVSYILQTYSLSNYMTMTVMTMHHAFELIIQSFRMKQLNDSYHYWELRSKHIWLAIKNVGDKTTIKSFSDVIITD